LDEIVFSICPTIFHPDYVVGVQFLSIKQVFSAYWAFPVLVIRHFVHFGAFCPICFTI